MRSGAGSVTAHPPVTLPRLAALRPAGYSWPPALVWRALRQTISGFLGEAQRVGDLVGGAVAHGALRPRGPRRRRRPPRRRKLLLLLLLLLLRRHHETQAWVSITPID